MTTTYSTFWPMSEPPIEVGVGRGRAQKSFFLFRGGAFDEPNGGGKNQVIIFGGSKEAS